MAPIKGTSDNDEDDDRTPIEIVTWYLDDPLSWTPLATLLSTNPRYAYLQKLELVDPTESLPQEESLQTVMDYIQHSRTLKELMVYTQESFDENSSSSSSSATAWRRLEAAVQSNSHNNVQCKIHHIQLGSRKALCDTLTPHETRPRHLTLDGNLLQGMTKFGWADLAKHLAWDRSIHTLVLKDFGDDNDFQWLNLVLQKVSYGTIQTLKIMYSPNANKNPVPVDIPTTPGLAFLLKSQKIPLQRLVFAHCHFDPKNTQPLVTALKEKASVRILDFYICQFDAGTGTQFQELVKDNTTLQQVNIHCPIFHGYR